MSDTKPYLERMRDAFDMLKEEYPGLYLTALDHKEGRNIFLNVMQRETNVDKAIMVKWLNEHTSLKYEIRRKRNTKNNR